jgi:hypothetical protein
MEGPDVENDSTTPAGQASSAFSTVSFRISDSNSVYSLQNTQSRTSEDNTDRKEQLDPYGNPIEVDQLNFYNRRITSNLSTSEGSYYSNEYRAFDDPNLDEDELEDK